VPVPLAELFVSVSADVSSAVNNLNSLNTQVSTTADSFKAAVPAALLFEAGAAAIGAGLVSSVKVAADFEHQMSGVKAVMAPGEVQQFGAALQDLALTLGRDTVFSSSEAAAGIEELIKAGIPAQAVLEGAGAAALALAAATGVPVAEAASVAATAMNTFGISAADLGGVVDVLAGTANASATDISKMQLGLAAVGPVAAQMGLSLTDTAAALGIFANNGLQGSDAGTSLKTMLLNLIPSTKAQTEEFKKLGLIAADGSNMFFDQEGHMRNLADIAEILKGSLGGLSDEQRISALQTLFGTDAVRAASILYKTGGDAVNAFHTEVGKVSAAQSAAIRLDNLEGTLSNLGGSFERVQIQIGGLFLPALRGIAEFAKNAVDAFGNLSPETQRLVVFIGTGAGLMLGLVGGIVLVTAGVLALTPAFAALNAVLFANPIGLIVLAIAALVTAAVIAFNTNEDFRNSVLGLWDVIQNKLWPAIIDAAAAVKEKLGPFFDSVGQAFGQFVSDVGPKVAEFFQTTLPNALSAMGTQISSLGPLFDSLTGFFGAVFNVIGSLANLGGTALRGLFDNVLTPGLQKLGETLGPLQPVFEGVGTALGTLFSGVGLIGEKLGPVVQFFIDAKKGIDDFATSITNASNNLPDWLKPKATGGGSNLQPASFNAAGGFGGSGGGQVVNITITTGPITDEASEESLAQRIAAAIRGSAGRVNPPPDNSGFPALSTGVL
jgi:TP901 family phage tail tape measure protein